MFAIVGKGKKKKKQKDSGKWLIGTWIPAGVYPVPRYGAGMTIVEIHFASDSSFIVPTFLSYREGGLT
jgi:hypothetical protein